MAVERQAESETGRGGGGTDAGEQGERRRRQGEEREEERGGDGSEEGLDWGRGLSKKCHVGGFL